MQGSRYTPNRHSNHPSFKCFTLINDWSLRPRVLTYTTKDKILIFSQYGPSNASEFGRSDIPFLNIQGPDWHCIKIGNIYNAPSGSINPGTGVSFLPSLSDIQLFSRTILAGDFNLHYPNWNPSYKGSPLTQAEDLIRWLDDKELFLISEVNTSTHHHVNYLDPCFATGDLIVRDATSEV